MPQIAKKNPQEEKDVAAIKVKLFPILVGISSICISPLYGEELSLDKEAG